MGQNKVVKVFASAAYTATQTSATFNNLSALGMVLIIDATAETGTASVVFKIQGVDLVSGKAWEILSSGTGTTILRVHPSLTGSANTIAKDVIPRDWNVVATHDDADSLTYSVSAHLVP
jgi:hypothetical protein